MCRVTETRHVIKQSMRECNTQELFPVEHACMDYKGKTGDRGKTKSGRSVKQLLRNLCFFLGPRLFFISSILKLSFTLSRKYSDY